MDRKDTPTKNIFEDFLLTKESYEMPVFKKHAEKIKNERIYGFSGEFIAVFRAMFMNMYHNRINPKYDKQEICHLSLPELSRRSRFSHDVVQRAIQYGLMAELIEKLETPLKAKCKYIPGRFMVNLGSKSYTQNGDK